jgi:hypothetical protein
MIGSKTIETVLDDSGKKNRIILMLFNISPLLLN